MQEKYKIIDLFSGAGGMTLGFVDPHFCGQFKSILAVDNEAATVKTYENKFGTHAVHGDIEKWLEHADVPKADVVIGGPPCQGFSLLNKKRLGDARRALWEPFMDVVEASGANVFVMENVAGLLKSPEFSDICDRADEMGFRMLNPAILNTADYGVPQTRKRTIAIGIKIKHFKHVQVPQFPPAPTHAQPDTHDSLPAWLTVKEAIKDLKKPKGVEIRGDAPPYNLHFGRNPRPVSMERYKAVPAGGNRFDLQQNRPDITPNCWLNKPSGSTDLFGRLWWDRPSVTIRTEFFKPEKGRYLHPSQHRPITHREAARLMSFPDDFKFIGSKIEVARQIGNAVPPIFAGHIAKFVQELLEAQRSGNSTKIKLKQEERQPYRAPVPV